jgi:hypothetical protein
MATCEECEREDHITVQTHGHGMTFVNVSYAKEYGIGKRKTFSFQTHSF